jgi:hypothetical protein
LVGLKLWHILELAISVTNGFINDKHSGKMKKVSVIVLVITTSFLSGFAFKAIISNKKNIKMKKVTGVGGIFFKCKDPKKMTEWYQKHLGLTTNPYGATFEWYEGADSTKKA